MDPLSLCVLFFVCWLKLKLKPDEKKCGEATESNLGREKIAFMALSMKKGKANKKAFELES